MYWFSALNREDERLYSLYIRIYRMAVITALKTNPGIKPYLILDGRVDEKILELKNLGVTIIQHRVNIYYELIEHYKDPICTGAYLRIDIPKICEKLNIEDDYILYTDTDVIFMGDISELTESKPEYFLMAGEGVKKLNNYREINSGVMWMNWKNMNLVYDNFVEYIKSNLNELKVYDQSALMLYFKEKIQELNHIYNYKPYWGAFDDIKILHFHGPKPIDMGGVWNINPEPDNPYISLFTPYYFEMVKYWNEIENEYLKSI